MSRVFKDCEEMIKEMDRELLCSGITCDINHYQNKKLYGEDRITKELMGVTFTISKPMEKRKEMLMHMFPDDYQRIEKYCIQEFADRVSPGPLNPGNSWKIRQDMWQKFMVDDGSKFDYTYNERLHDKLGQLINTLKEDKHSRQAVVQIFHPDDLNKTGGDTRIPCSVDYQFLIRNDRLYMIYHMRSSDAIGHFAIDIWLSAEMMNYIVNLLKESYPKLKVGSLVFFAGSFHAYRWDLSKRVIY